MRNQGSGFTHIELFKIRCGGRQGFTLIELLVVITIIVVLLALLVPAMDKAIYQAELAMCAARVKGVVAAVQVYATGANRKYPKRFSFDSNPAGSAPSRISIGAHNDRPLLMTFLSLNKSLQCPLVSAEVDFENPAGTNQVYASYSLYFGIGYPGQQGMKRLGDRWTWNDDAYSVPARPHRLSVLVGDQDIIYNQAGPLAQASHQDVDGKMGALVVQGGDIYSAWRLSGNFKRGTLDLNFGLEDGSVTRQDKITFDDPRMAKVPWDSAGFPSGTGHYMQVPPL